MRTFAILPAAGRSSRIGRPKLLLAWGPTTLIEHVLHVWRASKVDTTIVVTHPDDRELAGLCADAGTDVVRAEQRPADMKASIRLGLSHIQAQYGPAMTDACLWSPADMPLLDSQTINALIDRPPSQAGALQVPTYLSRRGHPLKVTWLLAQAVLGGRAEGVLVPENRGLDALFDTVPVEEVPVESRGILEDIDTLADYERLLALWSSQQEGNRTGE